MSRLIVLRRLLSFAVLAIVLASCSSKASTGYVSVTGALPELAGPSLTGGSLTMSSYAGRVVVVNFWNPYCSPCRREQRTLERAWSSLRNDGVLFIGVHAWGLYYPYRLSAATAYLRQFGVTYPVLDDPRQVVIKAFGVQDIPTTLVADRHGNLRFKLLGPVKLEELERLVEMASAPASA